MKEEDVRNVEEALRARGVKPTAMRILVCRELDKAERPLSLKDMEERMVTAERSTIFRTLTLLLQHHMVHGIEDGSGALKYEICRGGGRCTPADRHTHFHCERCQRTFCLHGVPVPEVELPEGFLAQGVNYMIKGICPECRGSAGE